MKADFKVSYKETKEMVLNTCRMFCLERVKGSYRMYVAWGGLVIFIIASVYMNPANKTPARYAMFVGAFAVFMLIAFFVSDMLAKTIGQKTELLTAEGEGEAMWEMRVKKWGKEPEVMVAFYNDHFATRIGKQQLQYSYDVVCGFMETDDLIGMKIKMKGGGKTLFAFPKSGILEGTPEKLLAFLTERCTKAKKEVKKIVIPEKKKTGYSIAIDGPAGAGKSTIAKLVAKEKGFTYVDTGAMYRALALHFLDRGIDPADKEAITKACIGTEIAIKYPNGVQNVYLNGTNVTERIREEQVGNMASKTSALPVVRTKLLELQREYARTNHVVMDGRDIGTCVLPDADVKVYLTASVETRAKRRYDELVEKGVSCDLEEIAKDIRERDERDMTREIAPLKQADDAVLVDSSHMTIEEVVETIINLCKK